MQDALAASLRVGFEVSKYLGSRIVGLQTAYMINFLVYRKKCIELSTPVETRNGRRLFGLHARYLNL